MKRISMIPRPDWEKTVEEQGLLFHSASGKYWSEEACYEFTDVQIDELERVTNELHEMCIAAAGEVIDNKRYAELKIPEHAIPIIEKSWEEEPPSLYGRFDLCYDGKNSPKMLEYNADTPTSLLEAAIIQYYWLMDVCPNYDQFNSLHEKLVATWTMFRPYLRSHHVHFSAMDDVEDGMTVTYLRDTAIQAGLTTEGLNIQEIGFDEEERPFDMNDEPIEVLFKLYPWEWFVEEIGREVSKDYMQIIEPAWKMILSNKGIMAILWELFPNHPNLLETHFELTDDFKNWGFVRKPLLSREGANILLNRGVLNNDVVATEGEYGSEGYIYQALCELPNFDGNHPVIGSWIIGQEAGGIGIRESDSLITTNVSRFVPHRFL